MKFTEQHMHSYTQGTPCASFCIKEIDSLQNADGLYRRDFFMLILLDKGYINQTIDFELHKMVPQSASLVFPRQLHELKLSSDVKAYLIMFDESVFCSEILRKELRDYNIDLKKRINYVPLGEKTNAFNEMREIWHSILKLYKDFDPVNKMQIKLYIKILILKLIKESPEKALVSTDNEDTSLYISFREKVDREYKTNRIVNTYANDLCVSVKRLTEVCKHFCGLTPLAIIHERLNLELKKTLAIGHLNIKEISNEFGFSSNAALNKYIVQKFGITPLQLKKNLQIKALDKDV